jgi:hypothetical protein
VKLKYAHPGFNIALIAILMLLVAVLACDIDVEQDPVELATREMFQTQYAATQGTGTPVSQVQSFNVAAQAQVCVTATPVCPVIVVTATAQAATLTPAPPTATQISTASPTAAVTREVTPIGGQPRCTVEPRAEAIKQRYQFTDPQATGWGYQNVRSWPSINAPSIDRLSKGVWKPVYWSFHAGGYEWLALNRECSAWAAKLGTTIEISD